MSERTPLDILWRGPLASCNYDCGYCPFAKTSHTAEMLARDAAALWRFVDWAGGRIDLGLGVLFTPWGEAMHLEHYRRALVSLSRMAHVRRVSIQTNGSGPLGWIEDACRRTLSLWITYHPGEIERDRFLERCAELRKRGVRFSVGIVGHRSHIDEAEALRAALPGDVYLWVNAYRDPANEGADPVGHYREGEIERLEGIDPWFALNLRGDPKSGHRSLGRSCRAGAESVSVDGAGDVRRCHFVGDVVGNLYEHPSPGVALPFLARRPCPAEACVCHIGHVHLDHFADALDPAFGRDALARLPLAPAT